MPAEFLRRGRPRRHGAALHGRVSYRPPRFGARLAIALCLNPLPRTPSADRILVVRLSALGDVVRTLPAVSSLRGAYPGAHIAWLVETGAASALEGQPWVDEILVFPRFELLAKLRGLDWPAAWRQFSDFTRRLRRRRFDLVLDFHSLLRSSLLARLSGAPRRVAYARPFGRELSYLLATDRARLPPRRMNRFERNRALLLFLGVEAPAARFPLRVDAAAAARAQAVLGPGPAPVAIHPGSSNGTARKRWSPARYAEVARMLAGDDGVPSLVTWGPARDDLAAAEAVVAAAGGAARLAPATPRVCDLAALLQACRLYVGGDTGPMHVASLAGTPVVQILGPTDPVENAPFPEVPSRSVRAGAGAAGVEVDPARVVAAARELLATGGGPAQPLAAGAGSGRS